MIGNFEVGYHRAASTRHNNPGRFEPDLAAYGSKVFGVFRISPLRLSRYIIMHESRLRPPPGEPPPRHRITSSLEPYGSHSIYLTGVCAPSQEGSRAHPLHIVRYIRDGLLNTQVGKDGGHEGLTSPRGSMKRWNSI